MTTTLLRAAVFRPGSQSAQIEPLEISELRGDEVLVKLVATGICHTDLLCRDGMMALPRPVVLGHEGSGIVESVGAEVTTIKPGDHVVMSFLSCGDCVNCRQGKPSYCQTFFPRNLSGRRLDGSTGLCCPGGEVAGHFFGQSSFASHSIANERNVVKVPDEAPLEILGPLGCGVQTGAGSVMNVLRPKPGQSLAVFGAGGVGLSAVMAAVVEGCDPVIVVEPNAERRALALELGATHAIDPALGQVVEQLRTICEAGLNFAFDTSGNPMVIKTAIDALGALGMIALVAGHPGATIGNEIASLIPRGITIRAVGMGDSAPKTFIPKLVDLIMQGCFPLHKIIRFYDFSDINTALEDQENGRAIKPVLRFP